jgi:hypothetical protein
VCFSEKLIVRVGREIEDGLKKKWFAKGLAFSKEAKEWLCPSCFEKVRHTLSRYCVCGKLNHFSEESACFYAYTYGHNQVYQCKYSGFFHCSGGE